MADQIYIILAAIAFTIAGLSSRRLRAHSIVDFSTRRDALSWFVIAAGVSMTFCGGAALVNMSALGYAFGWDALVDPIAVSAGIAISAVLVDRDRRGKGITMAQLLSSEYRPLAIYVGIITSVTFLLITSAQYVAFSKLLSPYFHHAPPVIMMLVPSAVITIYVLLGGFSAVTKTDVLQLILVVSILVLPVAWFAVSQPHSQSPNTKPTHTASMPIDMMILLCISVLYVPISQDMNIRAQSSRTKGTAIIGFLGGAFFYSAILVACIYMGITLAKRGVTLEDPETTLTISYQTFFPKWGILAVLAGMAAIWSTLDTYLVNTITSVSQDVIRQSRHGRDLPDRKLIVASGLAVFILAMLVALVFFQILTLVLTALLIYISVLIPIAYGRWLKVNDRVVLLTSILTTGAIIACEWFSLPFNPKVILYPASGIGAMTCVKVATSLRQVS